MTPTHIKDFPGQAVDAHLKATGRLPGESVAEKQEARAEHTAGPWELWSEPEARIQRISGVNSSGEATNIAKVEGGLLKSPSENLANARLIAAAPDLLAECKRAQDEIASAMRDGAENHFDLKMLSRWFNGVSAAIVKAEPEG